jgi:hypothetical protein
MGKQFLAGFLTTLGFSVAVLLGLFVIFVLVEMAAGPGA